MISFTGKYAVSVDTKGRVVLPSSFKKEMGEALEVVYVLEKDVYDRCLNVYPHSAWNDRVARLKSRLNENDPLHSKMLSRIFEEVVKVNMADNGRINIPNELLAYAEITREAVFAGQGAIMKLWEPTRHENSRLDDEDYRRLYQELLGGSVDNF